MVWSEGGESLVSTHLGDHPKSSLHIIFVWLFGALTGKMRKLKATVNMLPKLWCQELDPIARLSAPQYGLRIGWWAHPNPGRARLVIFKFVEASQESNARTHALPTHMRFPPLPALAGNRLRHGRTVAWYGSLILQAILDILGILLPIAKLNESWFCWLVGIRIALISRMGSNRLDTFFSFFVVSFF